MLHGDQREFCASAPAIIVCYSPWSTIPCAYLAFDIAAKRIDDEAVGDCAHYFGASGVIPPAVLAASLAAFIFLVSSAFCTQPSAVSMSFLY